MDKFPDLEISGNLNITKIDQKKKKKIEIDKICNELLKDLKTMDIHHLDLINTFNFIFKELKIKYPENAAIFYLLINLFEDRKYPNPSLRIFVKIAQNSIIFHRADATRTKFETIIEEFLDHGIVARILFTKSKKRQEGFKSRYLPTNPVTLWSEVKRKVPEEGSSAYNKYEEIINKFENHFYQQRFGLDSKKPKYNIIQFKTKWMIYLLSTYANRNKELSLQLSRMRYGIGDENDFFQLILDKQVNVQALLDKRRDLKEGTNELERAKELQSRYKKNLAIQFTYEELGGTSRRVILKEKFATDAIKILPLPEEKNNSGSTYVGVLYTEIKYIKDFESNFNSWWKQAISIEDAEKKLL